MLVFSDGSIEGTIGGGRLEFEMLPLAQSLAASQGSAQRWRRHLVRDLAMCCGGEMELFLEPCTLELQKVLEQAHRESQAGRPGWLCTHLNASSRCKTWIPWTSRQEQLVGTDSEDYLWELLLPPQRAVLFGAGHVSAALCPVLAQVGFEVTICDDEEMWLTAERFPSAKRLHDSFEPRLVGHQTRPLGIGDFVVIVTRDHAIDQSLLEQLLPLTELSFLGMIGSQGKLGRFKRRLAAKGVGTAQQWEQLYSPVGLEIDAETPEEIAVSIAAQMIQVRRRWLAKMNGGGRASSQVGTPLS
jgi:xanthine dehydrogenase accessory factor